MDHLKKNQHAYICPRALFFKTSPFKTLNTPKKTKRKTVGIQPGASSLGSHKAIPVGFIKDLVGHLNQEGYTVILFGTKKELSVFKNLKHKDIKFASDKNIIKNLSLVTLCDLFIGSDSVFKTMASMLKKPTIVLHEDSANHFRDRVFIRPYVDNKVMFVYKYKKLQGSEIKKAIQHVSKICREQFHEKIKLSGDCLGK
jgi:ADP-heptose:LPS heptosyltransferase